MSAVDEGLAEVDLSDVSKVLSERGQHGVEDPLALPLLKPVVAGLIRRVPPGHVRPRRTCAEDPEDPVEHVARIPPWPTPARGCPHLFRIRDVLANVSPLLLGEIHRQGYKHMSTAMEIGF